MAASPPRILWNAPRCARYVGVSIATWLKYTENSESTGAPMPANATPPLWEPDAVRDFTARHRDRAAEVIAAQKAERKKKNAARRAHRTPDVELWNVRQCAAHVGVPINTWRSYVHNRQNTGAPAPVQAKYRILWDADAVRTWHTQTVKQPGDWTCYQAAQHTGLSQDAFLDAVDNGYYPPPHKTLRAVPYWDAQAIRIRHADHLLASRAGQPTWTAQQCASHHGVSVAVWRQAAKEGAAPRPLGKGSTWSAEQVLHHPTAQIQAWEEDRRSQRARLIFEYAAWTAQDCADYHGIPRSAWLAAVRDSRAPKPLDHAAAREPVWHDQDVIALPVLG